MLAAAIIPTLIGYCVVWKTVLKDELKDMKLIRE